MITPDIKVSRMLEKYPQTLEVLLRTSPHFSKLNNLFLRKTLGSRVSIQQAAAVAGVSLKQLLTDLNKAIEKDYKEEDLKKMMDTKTTAEPAAKPIELSDVPSDKIIDLDVREDIKSGKDPIYRIKPVVQSLKEGEVLHLINSFEPVPLYYVLGNKGFAHWCEQKDDIFHVYFYKDKKSAAEVKETNPVSSDVNTTVHEESTAVNKEAKAEDIVEIDVRDLTPPEPMIKILSMINQMNDESVLLVHHHREPMMLYDKLEERGFTAVSHKINDNYYKVVITKKGK